MSGKTPNLFNDIREVVLLIPSGRVTSYGAIARYLGIKSARTVGWALSGANLSRDIPAHRVVNASGVLTGALAFESSDTMRERLENEGLQVRNNRVANFRKAFWDPSEEL